MIGKTRPYTAQEQADLAKFRKEESARNKRSKSMHDYKVKLTKQSVTKPYLQAIKNKMK